MNKTASQAEQAPPLSRPAVGSLQRKCACGNHTPGGGLCGQCAKQKGGSLNDPAQQHLGYNFSHLPVGTHQPPMARRHSPSMQERNKGQAFNSWGDEGTANPETGAITFTSTCCPSRENEPVSSQDKFSVIDAGAQPVAGGTAAQYRFEYLGATDSTGNCACNCCSFVQFVMGFFDLNGVRQPHTLPGSGAAMSATVMGQDSPILPHAGCKVATAGGRTLSDTPGARGIRPTDVLNIHLEFDARTIDTCNSSAIVASRLFSLDITGAHPRTFRASGNFG